jgi:hypothetical protein
MEDITNEEGKVFSNLPIMSATIDKIAAALAEVHKEIKPISKTSKVEMEVTTKGGGKRTISYLTATYSDMWEMTNDILAKNGLTFLNLGTTSGEKGSIIGLLVHTSGQYFKSELSLNPGVFLKGSYTVDEATDPKKVGSWITYLCKYMYKAMMNLPTDDDDGLKAREEPKAPKGEKKKKKAKKEFIQKDGCIDEGKVKSLQNLVIAKKERGQISKPDVLKILEVEADGVTLFSDIPADKYMTIFKAITEFGV